MALVGVVLMAYRRDYAELSRAHWPTAAALALAAATGLAVLLVPVMEELFWRSLLMRWLQDWTFTAVDPRRVGLRAVALPTLAFMLARVLWLAAIVGGLAYALAVPSH